VPGGHLDFFKMLKGEKSTPTWKHLPRPYIWIIRREKSLSGIANLSQKLAFFCQTILQMILPQQLLS